VLLLKPAAEAIGIGQRGRGMKHLALQVLLTDARGIQGGDTVVEIDAVWLWIRVRRAKGIGEARFELVDGVFPLPLGGGLFPLGLQFHIQVAVFDKPPDRSGRGSDIKGVDHVMVKPSSFPYSMKCSMAVRPAFRNAF